MRSLMRAEESLEQRIAFVDRNADSVVGHSDNELGRPLSPCSIAAEIFTWRTGTSGLRYLMAFRT